jgi:serine/threonine protein kinase
MLIFQNCFEIVMEKCWVCTNPLLREKALEFSSLQHSLHLMHRLGIFHFDVKPENIMFSSTLKKYVFIDYNLSRMREAEFGYKILSTFRGTLDFCYKEMFNLYSVEVKESFIDPYYNDAYALQASLKKIRY